MTNTQRTKLHWRIDYDGQISTEPTETDPKSHYICGFRRDSFKEFNEDDNAAVARPIRSAPSMLKLLKRVDALLKRDDWTQEDFADIQTVVTALLKIQQIERQSEPPTPQ